MSHPLGFLSFGSSTPSDPSFSNVELLLHGNGANGSTTFTDSSSVNSTFTVAGNAQISTTQSKFGGASMQFDGTGDYIYNDDATKWIIPTSGNFTLEGWIWAASDPLDTTNHVATIVGFGDGAGVDYRTISQFFTGGVSKVGYFINGSGTGSTISLSTWYHFAVVRQSTTQFYINGIAIGSPVSDTGVGTSNLTIGTDILKRDTTHDFHYNGYIDDLRYTPGVARYTGAFSPPIAQFPDH